MAVASGLALFASAANAQYGIAPDVKRMALIIANEDYDMDGKIKASPIDTPAPGYLKDLSNPCNDAKLFKDKLMAAHWRPDEIVFPACNVGTAEMRVLITNFRKKVSNSENTLAIFYYSGHGAQFTSSDTSHSFLFGVGAKLDLEAVNKSLIHSPGNTSAIATEAVDLAEVVRDIGRQTDNAVLVILDACRNNLLYGQLAGLDNAPAITSLSSNAEEFTGIVIAYSTSAGEFAGDGSGPHSIYTLALSSLLDPPRNLDSVLNKLRTVVAREYKKAYPNRLGIQEPVTHGRFTGDWCVFACKPTSDVVPVMARTTPTPLQHRSNPAEVSSVSLTPHLRRVSFSLQPQSSRAQPVASSKSPAPPSDQSAPAIQTSQAIRTVYEAGPADEAATVRKLGMHFDIFWCAGGAGADDRERRAAEIASALGREAGAHQEGEIGLGSDNALPANQFIASVRLRRLTAAANTSSGYRYYDDLVVYDQDDAGERAWSQVAARAGGGKLKPSADTSKTPGYISVFVCREPDKQTPPETTIYLQVPSDRQKQPARKFLEQLTNQVPTIKAAGGIETRSNGPLHTEVRFYDEEERNNAFATAKVMEQLLGRTVSVQFIPRLATSSTLGHMEIWLGKTDPPLSVNLQGVIPSNTPQQ
jgi:hypothetical protein